MPKFLRKFIVCMLIVALPTPGFAAAGMLACSPGHASMMSAPALDGRLVEAAQAPRHDHRAHHHALNGAHDPVIQDATAGFTAQLTDGAGALDTQAGTKCSACAACCFGAALVPGSVLPGTPEFSPTPLAASSPAPVSFITDGPVRPPRSFLA